MKRLVSLALCLPTLFCPSYVSAQNLPPSVTKGAQVIISASLGNPILKLWGYGAPGAKINLTGQGVSDFTYTGSDGYFEFPDAFLPASTNLLYPELCLTEIDTFGRATPPTCIPALPAIEISYDIGPVIIPPTLSLDTGSITPSSQAKAEGVTIPNSTVKIILAEEKAGGLAAFTIVRPAMAYYIPNYTVKSDGDGNFSFNMPGATPDTWHVFALTDFSQGATSPKSNTLKFEVISPTAALIANFWASLLSLLTLPSVIILEIVVILLIIAAIFLSKRKKKKLSPNISDPIKEYQSFLNSKINP